MAGLAIGYMMGDPDFQKLLKATLDAAIEKKKKKDMKENGKKNRKKTLCD